MGLREHPANPHLKIEMWGTRICGGSCGEPADGVREEACLQDGVEVGRAVIEDFSFAEARGEGARADLAVVVAGVGDEDLYVFAVD
jgi:hypothetical protein